ALPPHVQRRVQIVEGDMRYFAMDRRFSLVTVPYRAFLHNLTVEDQLHTLRRVREHLSDAGRLIFNVFDLKVQNLASFAWSMTASVDRSTPAASRFGWRAGVEPAELLGAGRN